MFLKRELTCRITLQACDLLCNVQKGCPVCTQDLDQRGFAVSRWRLFPQVLKELTVVGAEDFGVPPDQM